jgi:hypothetical protein
MPLASIHEAPGFLGRFIIGRGVHRGFIRVFNVGNHLEPWAGGPLRSVLNAPKARLISSGHSAH